MDAQEAVAQLKGARDLGQRLSDAASHSGAQALSSMANGGSLQQFTDQIDVSALGQLSGSLNNQSSLHDRAGQRGGSAPVHQFAKPVVVLDTPASATLASDGAIAQFAGEHLSQVAQGDIQLSAGHTAAQVSGHTTSLFSHAGGLQVKAANGDVSLRAHTDTLQLLAHKDIQITSINGEITVSAKTKIELIAADSGITLEGGDITFMTPGTWQAKGGFKEMLGGARGSVPAVVLPSGNVKLPTDILNLSQHYHDAQALAGAPYQARLSDGTTRAGKLDGRGQLQIDGLRQGLGAQVLLGPMPGAYQPRDNTPMPEHKPTPAGEDIDALLQKHTRSAT